jgi:hypothetical protein
MSGYGFGFGAFGEGPFGSGPSDPIPPTATITASSGGSSTPTLMVLPFDPQWTSRNLVYDTIGGGMGVVLVPPRPRSGVLRLLYASQADAFAAVALHRQPDVFTLTHTDVADAGMQYVLAPSGGISLELDEDTQVLWVVAIDYQAVEA